MTYVNTHSILHKIDPRFKIGLILTWVVATLFVNHWFVLMVFLTLAFILLLVAKIPLIYALKQLKIPAVMLLIMFAIQWVMTPSMAGIWQQLLVFSRLIVIILSVMCLLMTTKQTDFILSLEFFMIPMGKIGIQTGALILVFRIMQRFVPTIFNEANKILKAQASRGLDIKNANFVMKMRLIGALLLPVFVVSIKRADELANVMAIRGFVLNKPKSSYQTLKRKK